MQFVTVTTGLNEAMLAKSQMTNVNGTLKLSEAWTMTLPRGTRSRVKTRET